MPDAASGRRSRTRAPSVRHRPPAPFAGLARSQHGLQPRRLLARLCVMRGRRREHRSARPENRPGRAIPRPSHHQTGPPLPDAVHAMYPGQGHSRNRLPAGRDMLHGDHLPAAHARSRARSCLSHQERRRVAGRDDTPAERYRTQDHLPSGGLAKGSESGAHHMNLTASGKSGHISDACLPMWGHATSPSLKRPAMAGKFASCLSGSAPCRVLPVKEHPMQLSRRKHQPRTPGTLLPGATVTA